jgi:hypothetical protein
MENERERLVVVSEIEVQILAPVPVSERPYASLGCGA